MEERKYYTPAPEDIRPGLVYEYRRWPEEESCEWDKRVLPENGSIIQNILERLKRDTQSVRVPYLTAEQIEAEGWKVTSSSESGRQFEAHLIRDQKIKLYTYNGPANQLIVYHSQTMVFRGICRCINDLRTVCKLLGI